MKAFSKGERERKSESRTGFARETMGRIAKRSLMDHLHI